MKTDVTKQEEKNKRSGNAYMISCSLQKCVVAC